MPTLIGLKQLRSGEIGAYIADVLGAETGISSATYSKDITFAGLTTIQDTIYVQNQANFSGEVNFQNGFNYFTEVIGSGKLTQYAESEFLGVPTFKNAVYFTGETVSSGLLRVENSGEFNGVIDFNGTGNFNGLTVINGAVNAANGSVFTNSGISNLLGNVTLGVNSPASSNNYFVGTNNFSGESTFKNVSYFAATVNISGVTNFTSGNVNFSGNSQNFNTVSNFNSTLYAANGQFTLLKVTDDLIVQTGASQINSGLTYFYNDFYRSGNSGDYLRTYDFYHINEVTSGIIQLLDGSSINVEDDAMIIMNSGSSGLMNNGSIFKIGAGAVHQVASAGLIDVNAGGSVLVRTGGAINSSGNINLLIGSQTEINSGARVNLNPSGRIHLESGGFLTISSGFPSTEYGAEPGVTVPTGHLYLQKIEVNGYTYLVLAIKPYA